MADPIVQTFSSGGGADEALLGYKRTISGSSDATPTPRRDGQNDADSSYNTGDDADRSDVGGESDYRTRYLEAQKHIGKLEGENKAYRDLVEKFPAYAGQPSQPEQVKINDPLSDPDFVRQYKSTFGEDEITAEANLEMLKRVRDSVREEYASQVNQVRATYEQQMYYDQLKTAMWTGMQDATSTYGQGAQVLVEEFISSNGNYGVLADAIKANPRVMESADLVSALIGRLVFKSGGITPQAPQPQVHNPNPASRPTRSPSTSNDGEELSREEQIARSIVAAKSPSQALPFMR